MKNARFILIIFLAFSVISCSSIAFKEKVEVNENEDWLIIGSDPAKTNISRSTYPLLPPYNLAWKHDADAGFSSNCLSASDGVLFSSTLRGEIFAINIENGKSLGRISNLGKGSFGAPAIYNGGMIVTFNGDKKNSIINYDVEKGSEIWSRDIGMSKTSPLLIDNSILVSSISEKIYSLDKSSGNINWVYPSVSNENIKSFYTTPTVHGNSVIIGNTNGELYSLDLTSGSLKWKYKTNGPIYSDASVYNSKIYVGSDDSLFYCIDLNGKVIWEKDLETTFQSSASFRGNDVIIPGVDGAVYSLNGETGNINWKHQTFGAITSSPVIHNDQIFIGSFDMNFYCLDAKNGSVLWKYLTEGRIRTTALIWKNYIFAASEDRNIYCFTPGTKTQ